MELLFEHLTDHEGLEPAEVAAAMLRDYRRGGRGDTPKFLIRWVATEAAVADAAAAIPVGQKRQQRLLSRGVFSPPT